MTTREDLIRIAENIWSEFITHPPSNVWKFGIRMTSGTSQNGPFIMAYECNEQTRMRLADAHCALICLGSRNVRLGHVMQGALATTTDPLRMLALDAQDLSPGIDDLLADLSPDFVYGIPSFIGRTSEHMGETARAGVSTIITNGERINASLGEFLRSRFPDARIHMEYGVTEIGIVSGPYCDFLPFNSYHLGSGVSIDIDSPDETGAGAVLVTRQVNSRIRVEKYATGDNGRLLRVRCECGEEATLELMGRIGFDYVKICGAVIRREEFDRVVALFPVIHDYRAEASEVFDEGGKLRGKIILRVYSRTGIVTDDLTREILCDFSAHIFLTPTRTLADLVAEDVFMPLEIIWTPVRFPETIKDVKLSRK